MFVGKFLIQVIGDRSRNAIIFWLVLSLFVSLVYSLVGLKEALSAEYFIPDDARQHIFWMQRWLDPELFPDDWITDYFQSIAPPGYQAFYRFAVYLGLHPYTIAKLLPSLLGLITTVYGFGVCHQIFPIPFAGFMATLLLHQNLWMQDGLSSATPRAFVFPLAYLFLYYLIDFSGHQGENSSSSQSDFWIIPVKTMSLWGSGFGVALLGLFYPLFGLVAATLVIIRLWDGFPGVSQLQKNPQAYQVCFLGLVITFVILVPQIFGEGDRFGPVVSLAQAQTMPEFFPGGRIAFFKPDKFWDFWLATPSGVNLAGAITSPLVILGFLLPGLESCKQFFPFSKYLSPKVKVLWQVILASSLLFFAAHLLLFHLYLPSRYIQFSFRLVLTIASSIAFTLILQAILSWSLERCKGVVSTIVALMSLLIILTQVFYPQLTLKTFPKLYYVTGNQPQLYRFLQQQPKGIVLACLDGAANDIPSFAGRSVLVAPEYGLPFHQSYYQEFRQRTLDLIRAQYSPDENVLTQVIDRYNIDFWLLNTAAFEPIYLENRWLQQFSPAITEAQLNLTQGIEPALAQKVENCTVFGEGALKVLETGCLLEKP